MISSFSLSHYILLPYQVLKSSLSLCNAPGTFGDIRRHLLFVTALGGVLGRVHGRGEHPTVHRRVPSAVTCVRGAAVENSASLQVFTRSLPL